MRILVVDDEPLLRDIFQAGLEGMGYQVQVAESGKKALVILEKDPFGFDLVIVDLNMPGWDGLETVARLRKVSPQIPVLLATGYMGNSRCVDFMKLDRVDVINKPFKLDELNKAIKKIMS